MNMIKPTLISIGIVMAGYGAMSWTTQKSQVMKQEFAMDVTPKKREAAEAYRQAIIANAQSDKPIYQFTAPATQPRKERRDE